MATPHLVAAKLAAPQPPRAVLVRERLHRLLDGALDVPLTLVVGPAGSGKSTLVASWARARQDQVTVAWVNADAGDTADRLLRHIGRAAAGEDVTGDRGAVVDAVRRHRSRPLVLVIDDVHLIRWGEAIDELAALVEAAPTPLHVIVVSRVDPAFAPGWRASGRPLVELRSPDLRLTDQEVRDLVTSHPGVDLDPTSLEALTRKVSGWAAGLQLALASLATSADPSSVVRAFGGETPAVAEYFLDEVLAQLDPASRELLLDIAVLDRVSAAACRLLTGRDDAAQALAALAAPNLLIEHYSDDTYRVHPLLQQLLQMRLRLGDEDRFRRLHRLAADETEARGDLAGAVEHLLAAEDFAAVVSFGRRHVRELTDVGSAGLLLDWLSRLPAHALDDPEDQVAVAELTLDAGDAAGCALRLDDCRDALPHDSGAPVRRRIARVRSRCLHHLGEPEAALQSAREARAIGIEEAEARRTADLSEAFGLLWLGQLDDARARVATSGNGSHPVGDPVALGLAARIEIEGGALPAAAALVTRGLAAADAMGLDASHVARFHARNARAQLLVEDLADLEADDAVEALIADGQDRDARDHVVVGLCLRARLRWTNVCVAAGLGALSDGVRLDLGRPLSSSLRHALHRMEARLLIESGEVAEARRLLHLLPEGPAETVLAARALAAGGSPCRALDLLRPGRDPATGPVFDAALARARIFVDTGDDRAPAALRALLRHPSSSHLRRSLLDEGEAFSAALRASGPEGRLVAADLERARHRTAGTSLSHRELDVLDFLPTRLTNQQIGAQLFVSANTVKTHLKSLYRRLGVGSREEAVHRARQLGLLAPARETPRPPVHVSG